VKPLSFVALAVVTASCVTTPPPPKMSTEEAFAPATVAPVDASQSRAALGPPKEWARQYRRDIDCEREARALSKFHGRDVAWTYLKPCITRGLFTQLELLCGYWEEELKTKPEAPSLIAQVLAARGGHLGVDLPVLQKERIPVFELPSALKQPNAFKGRYVVFVGKIAETRNKKGNLEMVLLEQSLGSDTQYVMGTRAYGSTSSSSGKGAMAWRSSGVMGSGSASGSYSSGSQSVSGDMERRVTEVFEDTGQEIIARLKAADPFLVADKNLVFLVRFDGALIGDTSNLSEGEEPVRTALVTLVSYHEL